MPTVKDTAELLALKKSFDKLSAADRLRLCASLIEAGKYDITETLLHTVIDALRAKRLLGR